MRDFSQIKVLAFDIFGTVVDWHSSIIQEIEIMNLAIDANQFALDWRTGYRPAMDKVLASELPWTSIDDLHRMILDGLLIQYNINTLNEEQITHLNHIWHRLSPWNDSIEALKQLKEKYIICTLSNGNIRLLVDMAKHAKLPWDYIFSAENFRAYKPSPKTYLGVAELLNVQPDQVMMVAAHYDDLVAARACGLLTAYIERPLEFGSSRINGVSPCVDNDLHATDLLDLVRLLDNSF
ncbi:haloacid dehalogenase type II [Acinetobacter wuhouensis]|uniref:Haloacid dehalogenase type II n=1 Tax=Acinetobacter wuhouensis TaxID=1879050 RepID=A0A3G2T2Y6_9GAMM|nr:haloacid dehalogenase type II [Acinetobacter wuhouensis]AYO54633.1 haloacid dehalogenase type II [Acinetobacter wuhouensis]